ncbi:MAG: hypothetical protein IKV25_01730 [Clostridia bacterium]|nr:hypothetical protein [Clostridia bacterium]
MKKIFSCLIAILILLTCMIPSFAEDENTARTTSASLSVSASSSSVSVGDTINLTVKVSDGLSIINLTVGYNSEYFSYVSYSSGDAFPFCEPQSSTAGQFYCVAYGNETQTGGTIITVTLKVIKVPSGDGSTISASATGKDIDRNSVSVSSSGVTIKCSHANMTWETVKASTCKEQGTKKGTCPCGFTKEESLPLGQHNFGTPVVTKQPTCTETGIQVAKCTLCNAEGTPETVPAKGHQFDDASIKQKPTCTTTGTAVGKCNACGFESATPVTIPATGHNFGDWVVTREPNQLMSGEQRRVCNSCQYIETQMITKLPTTTDEPSTNPIEIPTQQTTPIEPNTQQNINNNNSKPNNNKDDDDKNGLSGLFGDEVSNSDKAVVVVIILAVVTVVTLAIYILLLQQRKKKE